MEKWHFAERYSQSPGCSQSTISRELRRNAGQRGYRYKQADGFAQKRHQKKPKAIKLTEEIKPMIDEALAQAWSPEQIAGRFEADGIISLHHETILSVHIVEQEERRGAV